MSIEEKTSAVDADWFRDRLQELGFSQNEFARRIGSTPPKMSQMLAGKRRITLNEACLISEMTGYSLDEVVHRAIGMRPRHRDELCPIRYTLTADGTLQPKDDGGLIRFPVSMPSSTVAAVVTDPRSIFFRWTYLFEPAALPPRDSYGRLCVVTTDRGEMLLRFTRAGVNPRETTLIDAFSGKAEDRVILSASPNILR